METMIEGMGLLLVALLPLVVVAALFVRPLRVWAARLGPLSALPLLAVILADIGPERVEIPWFLLGAQIGVDDTAKVFLVATGFVWVVAAIFAQSDGIKGPHSQRFFQFFYAAMAGSFLLIIAIDMVTFLTGFALMSYAGYGLVIHKLNPKAYRASRVYMTLVILAEVALFAGAVLAWSLTGSLELAHVREALAVGDSTATVAMVLLFCGFGVKAGLMPLHIWLPLAHPAAPVPASAVLSAAMIKAGLLGWIRFLPFGLEPLVWLGWWALAAGLFAVFAGVLLGLFQSHPKTILAYSSISQMGYMTLLLALAALAPELAPAVMLGLLVYVVHHSLAKGALFLAVAVARDSPRSRWWAALESAGLVIPALALAGAPLTTGAVAKHKLKILPFLEENSLPWFVDPALIAGSVATTVLMARFLWVVWPRSRRKMPISWLARGAWLVLATAVIWAVWLVPWELFRTTAAGMLEPYAIWSAFWPLALGGFLSVVVLRNAHLFPFRISASVPAGDLVVPLEWLVSKTRKLVQRVVSWTELQWQGVQRRAGEWVRTQERYLRAAEAVETQLKKQAWDWLWILVVGAIVLVAIYL